MLDGTVTVCRQKALAEVHSQLVEGIRFLVETEVLPVGSSAQHFHRSTWLAWAITIACSITIISHTLGFLVSFYERCELWFL